MELMLVLVLSSTYTLRNQVGLLGEYSHYWNGKKVGQKMRSLFVNPQSKKKNRTTKTGTKKTLKIYWKTSGYWQTFVFYAQLMPLRLPLKCIALCCTMNAIAPSSFPFGSLFCGSVFISALNIKRFQNFSFSLNNCGFFSRVFFVNLKVPFC